MRKRKENDSSPATKLKAMEDWDLSEKIQTSCYEDI